MTLWTILGWTILVASPLGLMERFLSFNPWRWLWGIIVFPFSMLWGLVILSLTSKPPTDREIDYYIYGVAILLALVVVSRTCSYLRNAWRSTAR